MHNPLDEIEMKLTLCAISVGVPIIMQMAMDGLILQCWNNGVCQISFHEKIALDLLHYVVFD